MCVHNILLELSQNDNITEGHKYARHTFTFLHKGPTVELEPSFSELSDFNVHYSVLCTFEAQLASFSEIKGYRKRNCYPPDPVTDNFVGEGSREGGCVWWPRKKRAPRRQSVSIIDRVVCRPGPRPLLDPDKT